jgi:hypothetical protein
MIILQTPSGSKIKSKSLVRASLELGRVLADCNGLTFRVKGTCMYPALRAGDVLRIHSCPAADVAVGDIAVGRKPGFLFAHRVIGKGQEKGSTYLITRPDNARVGSDGHMFDESLLGKVVAIERGGRPVPLHPTSYRKLRRRYHAGCRQLIELLQRLRAGLDQALETVQAAAFYRGLAKRWLAFTRPHLSYAVRLPMSALGDAAYRELSPEKFDVRRDWRGRPVGRFTLAAHVNGSRKPAAWTTFVREGGVDWRVGESYVRVRYRGWGLDEHLLQRADVVLGAGAGAVKQYAQSNEARVF